MGELKLANISVELGKTEILGEAKNITTNKNIKVNKYTILVRDINKCIDICSIAVPLLMILDDETDTYSIHTKDNNIQIELNTIPDDDFSVFVPAVLGNIIDETILCDIPIYIYKKRHIGQNKRIYGITDVKINNKGEIKKYLTTKIFYTLKGENKKEGGNKKV